MRAFHRQKPDQGKKMPGWIVSFTDMITLLLSFFIMLQALAKTRDPELFNIGRGGFKRAIAGLGIPDWLFGKREAPYLGHRKPKHAVEEDPENLDRLRLISEEDEKVRKLFQDLSRLMQAKASDHEGEPARLLATPIRFAPGSAAVGPEGREFLRTFAVGLLRESPAGAPSVHVIGLAPDAPDGRARWVLSARRARAVESRLRAALPRELRRRGARVDSWGAGDGRRWIGARPGAGGPAHVLLAVMESDVEE